MSPVALLTVMLSLLGAVVILRGITKRLLRQSLDLQTELRTLRKARRVLPFANILRVMDPLLSSNHRQMG